MRILYFSVHEVLEYDELKLFTELGHDCFSVGAYRNPNLANAMRPAIPEMEHDQDFEDLVNRISLTNLDPALYEDKDLIIVMHQPSIIIDNWEKIKHKRVIWRSIGQSHSAIEKKLEPYRQDGLEIIRYSPREKFIPGYIGEDAMIRFYKDPVEYGNWNGNEKQVIALNQSMKDRAADCSYDVFHQVCKGFPVKLYGRGNEGLPEDAGGLTYERIKEELRNNRVFFYTGTRVTSYTLGFIEAFMTGIPIVSIGEKHGNHDFYKQQTFEIPSIIEHGKDGYVSDHIKMLKRSVRTLLNNQPLSQKISERARNKAIELFGKETIKEQWNNYLR